jgi:hypothetical protein
MSMIGCNGEGAAPGRSSAIRLAEGLKEALELSVGLAR